MAKPPGAFGLSERARELIAELNSELDEESARLREKLNQQPKWFQETDSGQSVLAWLEEVDNLAWATENIDSSVIVADVDREREVKG